MSRTHSIERDWQLAIDIAREAAELVLRLRPNISQQRKDDGSIVTSADMASALYIRRRLQAEFPHDAVLTEEDSHDSLERIKFPRCWIVDPIDGTSAFASGSSDFDVYLALVEAGRPRIVVAHQPVTGQAVTAMEGEGTWTINDGQRTRIRLAAPQTPPVIVTRHWLGAPINTRFVQSVAEHAGGIARNTGWGISARTFVTEGVDAVIGVSMTDHPIAAKEWDVAPLDLIVREAGGWSSDLKGEALQFNKPVPKFPGGILLARTPELGQRLIAAIAQAYSARQAQACPDQNSI
jgi:3'-phosphoadenosine 5'-phosphosulfate (PAPS) 3'-phosphatase